MIKYVIKELLNNQYIIQKCYAEFVDDITDTIFFNTIEDAKRQISIYKKELYSDYRYEIHEIEIKDKGAADV